MNILILEDEIPAYQKLLSCIMEEIPEVGTMSWARSVQEAKRLLSGDTQPDLIFSDIELLDGVSFEVYEAVKVDCPIIFCTAFDQYVLKAFQTNGIAYLLKPYSIDNFREAYQKYKTLFSKKENQSLDQNLVQELKQLLQSDKKSYKKRFTVKKKDGIKLVDTQDIIYFEANGDFSVAIENTGAKHVINNRMADIEEKINPARFFRINRSQIVNIDFVEKVETHFKNKLSIQLRGVKDALLTSANKTPSFRKWLEGE